SSSEETASVMCESQEWRQAPPKIVNAPLLCEGWQGHRLAANLVARPGNRPKNGEASMKAVCLAGLIACALAAPAAAQSADSGKQIAARVELHAIPSLTLTDQQFLSGDANGKPVTVTGELRIAQGTGKLPVVVLVHGSGGMGPNIEMWAREFNAIGVS